MTHASRLHTALRLSGGAALVLVFAAAAAGGFHLSIERPGSGDDPALRGAVVVVRPFGCIKPENAQVTATAEGIVDGRRQSRPVALRATADGAYAIHRQWPADGTWVLAVTGRFERLTSSALVELSPDGQVKAAAGQRNGLAVRYSSTRLSRPEIDAALASAHAPSAPPSQASGRSR